MKGTEGEKDTEGGEHREELFYRRDTEGTEFYGNGIVERIP